MSLARYVVLLKGLFDVLFALGIVFVPIVAYDGPVPAFVSKATGLPFIYRDADPGGVHALASLIMGCAVAALAAGTSRQDDAYKVIAVLNAAFACTGFASCLFSPKKLGSSFLLLASLQDLVWFFLIVGAGGFTVGEAFGLNKAVEKVHKKKEQVEREHGQPAAHSEKEKEKEGHGSATGAHHGGLHQEHRQTRSSTAARGGLGSGGAFGIGPGGTGNQGTFANQTEFYRGAEPHQ